MLAKRSWLFYQYTRNKLPIPTHPNKEQICRNPETFSTETIASSLLLTSLKSEVNAGIVPRIGLSDTNALASKACFMLSKCKVTVMMKK
jgi:hypothetical protein